MLSRPHKLLNIISTVVKALAYRLVYFYSLYPNFVVSWCRRGIFAGNLSYYRPYNYVCVENAQFNLLSRKLVQIRLKINCSSYPKRLIISHCLQWLTVNICKKLLPFPEIKQDVGMYLWLANNLVCYVLTYVDQYVKEKSM